MSSENQLSEQAALESIDVQKHDKQMNELLVRQLKRVADACEERTKTGPVQGSISAPASLSSYGPSGRRAASESASSGFGRNGGRDRKSESANPPAPRNPKGRDISAANDYESDPDARAFAGAAVARRSRWPNSSNVRDDSNKAAPRHTKRRRNSSSSSSSSTSSSDSDSGHKQRGRGKGRGGTERLGQAPDRTGGQAMPASSQSNSNQVGPLNYPGFCAGAAFAGPPTGALGGPTVALSHHEVGMPRGPMSISPTCAQAPLPDGYRAVPESVRDYVYFVKLIVACLNMYHDFQLRKLQEEYHSADIHTLAQNPGMENVQMLMSEINKIEAELILGRIPHIKECVPVLYEYCVSKYDLKNVGEEIDAGYKCLKVLGQLLKDGSASR